MNSIENRLIFALAVLKDKDRDAILILADLLESEGELGMAIFLRAKKKSWQKRMDCVIGVLPALGHLANNLRFRCT